MSHLGLHRQIQVTLHHTIQHQLMGDLLLAPQDLGDEHQLLPTILSSQVVVHDV